MPMLVYEVYQTALKLQRDVLYVQFYDRSRQPCEETIKVNAKNDEEADALWKAAIDEWGQYRLNECPELPIRQTVIDCLDSKGIGWSPSVVRGLGYMGGGGYEGDIYRRAL